MTRKMLRLFVVAGRLATMATLLAYTLELHAQVGMATLSGVVKDPSGGGIPGAQVDLESTTEHSRRQTASDNTGAYVIPAINPGTYQLVVKASGFATQTLTDIVLTSDQGTTLNVTLVVGRNVTEVSVKEAPPLLETTTSTVGSEVTSTQFTELPTLGRNFTELIGILPGTVKLNPPDSYNLNPQSPVLDPSVYGQRQRDNEFTLDGVPNYENLEAGVPMFPPPEAIAEMKVSSGMDSGAYGWAGGANINVVTKSGTNQYHGDAWEFLRNDALNARSYFTYPSVTPFKWNQFGGTFGGPIVIPHLVSKRNAWYVFGYYEGVRLHERSQYTALVPTAAELNGDFSADPPIYNPYTSAVTPDGSLASRQAFTGNQIPSDLLDPHALAFSELMYPLPNLAPGVVPGANFLTQEPNNTTSNQWSVRADHQFGTKDNFYARYSDMSSPTYTAGPPALSSTATYHFTNMAVNDTHVFSPTSLVTLRLGMQRSLPNFYTNGPANLASALGTQAAFPPFEGKYATIPPISIPGYPGVSNGPGINGPEFLWSYSADVQKMKGRHSLAFGGAVRRQTFFTDCLTGEFECFATSQTASPVNPCSGDALASFFLGLPEAAGRTTGVTAGDMSGNAYSLYMQDTFRASPRLTLNLGLRWDYAAPLKNTFGSGTFQWENGVYYFDLKNPITGAAPNIRRGLISPDYRGYQPRLGVAYQFTPKTVVRSGFGIFSEAFGIQGQAQQGNHGNWPVAYGQTEPSLNLTLPTEFLENPFPGPPVATPVPLGVSQGVNAYVPTSRTGYVEEWSATVQRQITPSLGLEVAYFGSHGTKLGIQIVENVADVPGTGPVLDRVKWPNFPAYVENGYNEAMSWYDGLSLRLERKTSKNLTFLVDYTWSKTMDQVDSLTSVDNLANIAIFATPTRFDLGEFKGPAGFNVRHVFNASYIYEIPAKSQSRLVNSAIAHWSLSGIISADDGVPYVSYLSFDDENIGTVGRYNEFPDVVGNPNSISNRSIYQWFNTAAYVIPPLGTAGTAGKYTLYSDPEINWDTSLYKRWPFSQETKDLEFRAEFFNFLNASTFNPPGTLVPTPQFGTISSTRQNGRQIQFALKFHF
jgi:hypothetical protein